jgi:hypothetical protein
MIRANSLDGKTTYLWRLVFDEGLDNRILGTMKRVADAETPSSTTSGVHTMPTAA